MSADPFGIVAAQRALDAALAAREATILDAVLNDGWTHAVAAEVFGVSRQRIGQIVARHLAAARKGAKITPAQRLAEAREAYRLAVAAQQLRAESYSHGYQEETRAFYGDESVSAAEVSEQRLTWRTFLREYQEQNREPAA